MNQGSEKRVFTVFENKFISKRYLVCFNMISYRKLEVFIKLILSGNN